MPGDYTILAPIYDEIGMGAFAQRITPALLDYAQHVDWLGRRILVLGCGTGTSIEYLLDYRYSVTGIDNSPEMLAIASRKLDSSGVSLKLQQADIRELGNPTTLSDMALAINVMNELNSLRDLETVFGGVQKALEPGKLFIFDMMTVQGLAEDGTAGDQLLHNNPQKLTVFASNDYDYERQMQTCEYFIFQQEGGGWTRREARRIVRAYPVQAVGSLLQRSGFNIRSLLTPTLEVYDPNTTRAGRVIFVAERQ